MGGEKETFTAKKTKKEETTMKDFKLLVSEWLLGWALWWSPKGSSEKRVLAAMILSYFAQVGRKKK